MKNEDKLDHLLKVFARGSIIVFVGVLLSKIFTYLYRVIIARTFGQEIYGLFSLALMISSFFIVFFSLGLPEGLTRYIPIYRGQNKPEKIKSIFHFSINLTLWTSFISGALLFLTSQFISVNIFHNYSLIPFLQFFAIFVPISIFAGMFHILLKSHGQIREYSFIGNILSPGLQLVLLGLFIFMGWKNESILLSYNLGILAILFASFIVSRKKIKGIFEKSNLKKELKPSLNKKLFSYSWPIMFFGMIALIFSWIDSFAIGYFKSASEVGLYNVAIPLINFLLIVPSLFFQFFLPIITKEYSRGNFKVIIPVTKQITKWVFILNLPIFIFMVSFPGVIINILFGAEYIGAENVLRMLSIGVFIYSVLTISESILSLVGKSKIILLNIILATITNVILNLVLVPRYGINGAAFSTMIGYSLWGILSFFTAKKNTSINPLKRDMIKISLIAAFLTLLLFYIKNMIEPNLLSLFLTGFGFLIAYFSLIFLTHSLDKNDLMIIQTVKNKLNFPLVKKRFP